MARSVTSRAPAASTPGAIPHSISDHLCIDFVNSRFTDHTGTGGVHDRIGLEEWRRWYSARCGVAVERPPSAETRLRLVELRDTLRKLLESRQRPRRRHPPRAQPHAGAGAADLAAVPGRTRPAPRPELATCRLGGRDGRHRGVLRAAPRVWRHRPDQGLRQPRLLVHVLRRDPKPIPAVVRGLGVRQPRESSPAPGTAAALTADSVVPGLAKPLMG